MPLFSELKRRNVFRIGAAYVVAAWLIIQVVETIFPAFGFGETAVRITVIVLAVGFVPALIVAWAFELTPEGFRRERDVDHSTPAMQRMDRRLDRLIIAVLALALGYFAIDKFVLAPAEQEQELAAAREAGQVEALLESYGDQSIAVLAFTDLSRDGDQEYLSDGLAVEIMSLLGQIPELRVISRSSSFQFKGQDLAIPAIAAMLNVAHVLQGSVRRDGNRIRVAAQLIDAEADRPLWSDTWDRMLDDVFEIQDELAATVVEQLQLTLLGEIPQADRIDPHAYMLYLQAIHAMGAGDNDTTIALMKQALAIEPDYFDAWLHLSLAAFRSSRWPKYSDEQRENFKRLADDSFERARNLEPGNPVFMAWDAWEMMDKGDYATAADMFARAIAANPNDWEILRPAIFLTKVLGRFELGRELAEYYLARDPLCWSCYYQHYKLLRFAGDFPGAEWAVRKAMTEGSGGGLDYHLGLSLLLQGDTAGARQAFSQLPSQHELLEQHGMLLARIIEGDSEGLEDDISLWINGGGDKFPDNAAQLYAMYGDRDRAFQWLEEYAGQVGQAWLAHQLRFHLLANLHEDPRWQKLLERAGIAENQLAEIEFDVDLPDSGH